MKKILRSDALATVCAVLLLLGAAGSRLTRPKASDASDYHSRVSRIADGIALRTGDWIGTDIPMPTEAISELKPNVVISRRLHNVNSGASATLLLVQCRDVRDLAPHYPPVCYPGHGLTLTESTPVQLQVGDMKIDSTRYTFEANNFQSAGTMHVDNFMILPSGKFQADMQGMERRIGADQRYFGAAEVQILHEDRLSPAEQTAESESIVLNYKPLIESIANGARK